ncbi:MAG TPA: hypothetical protein VGQ09_15505 [Chitinophagaceae bacterium]|jgi:hypothetical protein|nr:hypothetical protein [Chitinophagaceae bacterium]
MSLQIINDGACVRIQNDTAILLITKSQIKTIDTVRTDTVRLDIGEGALKNIYVRYTDVTDPVVQNAAELKDAIKAMLATGGNSGSSATEQSQLSILTEIQNLKSIFRTQYYLFGNEVDLTKREPSKIDESNPNVIYKGWHKLRGVPADPEWGIQRITRTNDIVNYEWAMGSMMQNNVWDDRVNGYYLPYDYVRIIE